MSRLDRGGGPGPGPHASGPVAVWRPRAAKGLARTMMVRAMAACAVLGCATPACAIPAGKLGEVVSEGDSEGDGDQSLPPGEERVSVLVLDDAAIDLLVVMDNSGSMGSRQIRATEGVVRFAQRAQEEGADVRIGFTTTDNGNPWCQGTGPEAGQLLLSSCASRLGQFVFNGSETIDVAQEACLDRCDLESMTLAPTATHLDVEAEPRPWIELSPAGDNLGGLDRDQVVSCAAPQGIDGCGFESPMETMYKTVERSKSPSDGTYGFLRPWARLVVVFVTDEIDCSVDSAWEEIFLPDGNRVFWGDPDAAAPSSSVCWNAGVQCENESGALGACNAQNFDVEGNVTDAAGAVMFSLTRYIEQFEAVEQSKAAYRPEHSVSVAVIAGVPHDGSALTYSRGLVEGAETFATDFGVDPGCWNQDVLDGPAVPPVRMRALAELFPVGDQAVLHSVCADDYGSVFEEIVSAYGVPRREPVACIPGCLADLDPESAGTQAQCDVVMSRAGAFGRESALVPDCDDADPGHACYRLHLDDEAVQCAAQGSNAVLELVLPPDMPVQGHVEVEAACELTSGC